MKINWAKWARRVLTILMAFVVVTNMLVLVFKFVDPPLTPLMLIRTVEQWWDGKPLRIRQDWVPFNDVSENLSLAVMASEDQKFFDHAGFDWDAIDNAVDHNENSKRKVGASTITQQTAKNLFLWPQRSWLRKGLEAYFTVLLEFWWSKTRIMEVYLNIIETGDGIYGAEAACRNHFNHGSKRITAAEAASLAAILPNPLKWSPTKPLPGVRRRKNWILGQMRNIRPKFD